MRNAYARWARFVLLAEPRRCWAPEDMPRFRWENFTTADGLPNNRVYSVAVDGDRVWAGTDNGLALYEGGKWKVFTTADGLAHRAFFRSHGTSDARFVDRHHGRLEPLFGRALRHVHQLNSGLANDVVYKVTTQGDVRLGGHRGRRQPLDNTHRPVEPFQRAQHSHERDLDLQR
jgi:ligand-binding sensor domain-containing protein